MAAGFTLLQRCAPLVRALAGRRAGILLPTSPGFLTALAASDGRGAVLIDPLAAPDDIAHQVRDAGIGAVFTSGALQGKLPAEVPRVLLDESPSAAVLTNPGGDDQRIDLGSHFGLSLEGDPDAPGRDEECAIVYTSPTAGTPLRAILTHRSLMADARATVEAAAITAEEHVLAVLPYSQRFGLTTSLTAPLFAGARITTMARFNAAAAVELVDREGITLIVGVPAIFSAMLTALERRGGFRRHRLRLGICGGAPLDAGLQQRWESATGVALRPG